MKSPIILIMIIALMSSGILAQEKGAEVAFTVGPNDMIPEGFAHDPVSGRFFLSSFRHSTIYEISPKFEAKQMFPSEYAGLLCTVGMEVDAESRVLWVCFGSTPLMIGYDAYTPRLTGIAKIDLEKNEIVAMHSIKQNNIFHIFNDITIASDGTCYVSGFFADVIYRVNPETAAAERWLETPKDFWPNGIALTDDGEHMYISGRTGLIRIDLADKSIQQVAVADGESLVGIDGLYTYGNSLVAVQSLRGYEQAGSRIAQFFLDESGLKITRIVELDRNHPSYDQPTTGEIVGDWFYFHANSQFNKFDQNFILAPSEELRPVTVLKVKLIPAGR